MIPRSGATPPLHQHERSPTLTSPPAAPTTPLDPRQIGVWRTGAAITALVLLLGAGVVATAFELPAAWLAPGLAALTALAAAFVVLHPPRRHRAWRYDLAGDELLVERGALERVRTVVPLARVQHIDVAQGPLERRAGLGRLVVHTAGTASGDVAIPGLPIATAEAMRDHIRSFVRQDTA